MFRIPNLITLVNLLSGCLAILFLFQKDLTAVLFCLLICLLADFLDGFVARLLKSYSEMGKELDSLADIVSFGVLPGFMLFYMIQDGDLGSISLQGAAGFVLTLFAALRLAKFNIDTRQGDTFMGLNTPAATVFTGGLLLIYNSHPHLPIFQWWSLLAMGLGISLLMVSDLPMFSSKFKGLSWKGNEIRYIFIIFAVGMFLFFRDYSLSVVVATYILYSLGAHMFTKTESTN